MRSLALLYLYTHCLYIDSSRRLELLVRTFSSQADVLRGRRNPDIRCALKTLPGPTLLDRGNGVLRSLYLAPYKKDEIDDLSVATMIASLFEFLHPSLVRLVIDIRFRSFRNLFPFPDVGTIRPILLNAFRTLTSIEEFTIIQDELFLSTREVSDAPVFSFWPRLKYLALNSLAAHNVGFIKCLEGFESLECIALTRPDWSGVFLGSKSRCPKSLRRVSIIDTEFHQIDNHTTAALPNGIARRQNPDRGIVETVKINVPLVGADSLEGHDVVAFCRLWMREKAIGGTLWDLLDGKEAEYAGKALEAS